MSNFAIATLEAELGYEARMEATCCDPVKKDEHRRNAKQLRDAIELLKSKEPAPTKSWNSL